MIGEILEHGRRGGRMSVVGLHYRPVPTNFTMVLMKEFTIRGSFEYPPRFEDAVELLEPAGSLGGDHPPLPLEEFGDGLDLIEGSADCGKVMIGHGRGPVTNRLVFDFGGTTALVTGGTSGIGHAVASAFVAAGAVVTVTGTRTSAADYERDLARSPTAGSTCATAGPSTPWPRASTTSTCWSTTRERTFPTVRTSGIPMASRLRSTSTSKARCD